VFTREKEFREEEQESHITPTTSIVKKES